jgi:hypothetical protein
MKYSDEGVTWQSGYCALQLPKVHCGAEGDVDEHAD